MKKLLLTFALFTHLVSFSQSVNLFNDNIQIRTDNLTGLSLYRIIPSNSEQLPTGIQFGRIENNSLFNTASIRVKQFEFSHSINGFGKFVFNNGFGEEMSINVNNVIHNNFTKLGSDAPAIKLKKLTSGCTTSANSGFPSGEISLTHGITPSKILKVEPLVEYATNFWAKDGNDLFGYEFDVYVTNTTISLRNLSGSASSEIRSKPCKILITYEE